MLKITLYFNVLVVLFQSYFCYIINDINPKMISRTLSDVEVDDITAAELTKQVTFAFPGTKWCGPGNIADGYDDLGKEKETDMCCREHDHCPDVIVGGQTKHNLTNTAVYSRLNCACDGTFKNCLKATNTRTARLIGNLYFNALQTRCFREDFPIIKCIKTGGWFRKCLVYMYDKSGARAHQWFDMEEF